MWTSLHWLLFEIKHFADDTTDLEQRLYNWATEYK